jgi:hypothetical protein
MQAFKTTDRRRLLSTGVSLIAAAASFMLLPKVHASNGGEANDRVKGLGSYWLPLRVEGSHHTESEMAECIKMCQDCHALCIRTTRHCLNLGGRHAAPEHIGFLVDCAQLCEVNIDYMLRRSSLHQRVCGVCAEACKLCGDSCAQVAADDQMLMQCVDLCRRCAESCERMASKASV